MGNSVEKWTETYSYFYAFFLLKNKKLKNDLEIQKHCYITKKS